MIYCVDIDSTLCGTKGNDYPNSVPIRKAIAVVNRLYDDGNIIKIFTGRGSKSGKDWRELTLCQLKEWGVKYHELIMGKPDADYFIDDKNITLVGLGCKDSTLLVYDIEQSLRAGGKILICGNGGLAAESSHFAGEMMGQFAFEVFCPCIALVTDMSLITAISNDMGYENVFSHQVRVLGNKGDIFIGMTSSQSKNVVTAEIVAREQGLTTVMICGQKSHVTADYILRMGGNDVAEIQNNTIQFLHTLAYEVKKAIWEKGLASIDKPQQ